MDSILDALRMALLWLSRRRGLTTAIVLILALGIGLSTAVFSVVRHVLLHPIPASRLDRLVVAWETDPAQPGSLIEVSLPYFLDWRAESRSFADLAAFGSVNWSHELEGAPRRETVPSAAVSASFFETLRARPLLGRAFVPRDDDPASGRVLLLSYALWQRRFSGDPSVVGTTTTSGGQAFTIVGVMPREFDFPQGAQVWVPLGPELDAVRRRDSMSPADFRSLGVLYVLGRLGDGVSPEAARTELAGISHRLSRADGFSREGWGASLVPLVDHYLGAIARRALETLAAASGFVLVLACANVATLLLVQAIRRQRDLAVRRGLGATSTRIALDHLAEGLWLAAGGGLAGAFLAHSIVRVVVTLGSPEMPALAGVTMDRGALLFAFVVSSAAAVAVSVAPAWLATHLAIAPFLKASAGSAGSDRRGWNLSRLFVAAEVALSIALLVGCGLMARSLGKLLKIDLGFVPDHALSFSVDLPRGQDATLDERRAFHRALIDRLAVTPGIEAVGGVSLRPLELGPIGSDSWVFVEGQPLDRASVTANAISVNWEVATPGYFRAIGTRLVAGRAFDDHDTAEAPKAVIVSEGLARRCWPGQNALGKRLHTNGARSELKDGVFVNVEWQTVVGVVQDARYRGIQNPRPDIFLADAQAPEAARYLVVRATGDPLALVGAVRERVRALDADATIGELTTMSRSVDRALAPWRFARALLAGFAFAALALTASGLFAVLHHFVAERARDIAIRMALGAGPRRVLAFVLSQGLGVTALGLTLGLALSAALARALSTLLYGVDQGDPWSYLGGATLVATVAVAACVLPARRAAAIDPADALRSD